MTSDSLPADPQDIPRELREQVHPGVWDISVPGRAKCVSPIEVRLEGRRQDGGVEVRELTSSYKDTNTTTNCLTTIDQKVLEPTKKDILHRKTKKNQQ